MGQRQIWASRTDTGLSQVLRRQKTSSSLSEENGDFRALRGGGLSVWDLSCTPGNSPPSSVGAMFPSVWPHHGLDSFAQPPVTFSDSMGTVVLTGKTEGKFLHTSNKSSQGRYGPQEPFIWRPVVSGSCLLRLLPWLTTVWPGNWGSSGAGRWVPRRA